MAKWIYRKCNTIAHVTNEVVDHITINGSLMNASKYAGVSIIRNGEFTSANVQYINQGDFMLVDGQDKINESTTDVAPSTDEIKNGSILAKSTSRFIAGIGFVGRINIESQLYQYKDVYNYEEGSFIEEITAEEGIFPDNGRHIDGFWYIKTKKAISSQIKIDGVVKDIVGYELKGYGSVSLQFKDDKGIIHDI